MLPISVQCTPRLGLVAKAAGYQSIPPVIVMRARFVGEMTAAGWVRRNASTDMLRHVQLLYLQLAPRAPLLFSMQSYSPSSGHLI